MDFDQVTVNGVNSNRLFVQPVSFFYILFAWKENSWYHQKSANCLQTIVRKGMTDGRNRILLSAYKETMNRGKKIYGKTQT